MKRCEVGETIRHYIPEFYNDWTGKWTDIESFKKPYTSQTYAEAALRRWAKYHDDAVCRIRVETYAATAVDYVDVKLA